MNNESVLTTMGDYRLEMHKSEYFMREETTFKRLVIVGEFDISAEN